MPRSKNLLSFLDTVVSIGQNIKSSSAKYFGVSQLHNSQKQLWKKLSTVKVTIFSLVFWHESFPVLFSVLAGVDGRLTAGDVLSDFAVDVFATKYLIYVHIRDSRKALNESSINSLVKDVYG